MPALKPGQVTRYPGFPSRHVTARQVEVWTPPSYEAQAERRCPVIYMHDGQNLFDPATATAGITWGINEAMEKLEQDTGFPGAIVVGVWCSGERWRDYMPAKPLRAAGAQAQRAQFIEAQGGEPLSDLYLRFLVEEVKPFVDGRYRTQPDQAHTYVMGSSMGGLVSLYAICEYPRAFAGAGCLSTHWPAGGELLVDELAASLPPAGQHRLYFDYGTETLDAGYEPFQRRMDAHLVSAGYTQGGDWLTLKFEGAEHSERAWRQRVHLPLRFLFGL